MSDTAVIDRAAVAFSLACALHCVALPVAAIALPVFTVFAEAEWVHRLLTFLAIAASSAVIATARSAHSAAFLLPALTGSFLIAGALFADVLGVSETLPAVTGGILLAAAHIYRLARHR